MQVDVNSAEKSDNKLPLKCGRRLCGNKPKEQSTY